MRLLSLELTNFKGCRSFKLDTQGGCSCSIYGDNGTYKTTLFDAFLYLLFGKDSQNKKDFEIKTLDSNNQAIPKIDHEVEAVFEIGGRTLTLRKVYREIWTKKKGSATSTFTGHSTDYFIDGVPNPQKEYADRIARLIDEGIFKLLTSPTYFNEQIHWQKRRELLLEICGDIDEADVIASDPALAKLPEILNGRKLDDHRKVIMSQRTEINAELEKIPTRVDEAARSLPAFTQSPETLERDIADLKAKKDQKQGDLLQLQQGGEVARLKNKMATITAELQELKNVFYAANESFVSDKRKALGAAEISHNRLMAEHTSKTEGIAYNALRIVTLNVKAELLRSNWHKINTQQLEFMQETACPTCGQDLPVSELISTREKAEAAFNRDKAEKLEAISKEGKAVKAEIVELEAQNAELQKQADGLTTKINASDQRIGNLKLEIASSHQENTVEDWPGYLEKLEEKVKVEAAIINAQQGNSAAIEIARREVAEVEADIARLEAAQAKVEQFIQGKMRIQELEAQEKMLASEYEKLEGELHLADLFIKAKVNLLDDRINKRFKYARFKMFNIQINGGLEPCCETLYGGVPYSGGLNNAARINVGIDIINTLAEHYGFNPPIFIDNKEAVTRLTPTKAQVISLIVSEQDKSLRVECEAARQQREAV